MTQNEFLTEAVKKILSKNSHQFTFSEKGLKNKDKIFSIEINIKTDFGCFLLVFCIFNESISILAETGIVTKENKRADIEAYINLVNADIDDCFFELYLEEGGHIGIRGLIWADDENMPDANLINGGIFDCLYVAEKYLSGIFYVAYGGLTPQAAKKQSVSEWVVKYLEK